MVVLVLVLAVLACVPGQTISADAMALKVSLVFGFAGMCTAVQQVILLGWLWPVSRYGRLSGCSNRTHAD